MANGSPALIPSQNAQHAQGLPPLNNSTKANEKTFQKPAKNQLNQAKNQLTQPKWYEVEAKKEFNTKQEKQEGGLSFTGVAPGTVQKSLVQRERLEEQPLACQPVPELCAQVLPPTGPVPTNNKATAIGFNKSRYAVGNTGNASANFAGNKQDGNGKDGTNGRESFLGMEQFLNEVFLKGMGVKTYRSL